jgi:hypothetical protein
MSQPPNSVIRCFDPPLYYEVELSSRGETEETSTPVCSSEIQEQEQRYQKEHQMAQMRHVKIKRKAEYYIQSHVQKVQRKLEIGKEDELHLVCNSGITKCTPTSIRYDQRQRNVEERERETSEYVYRKYWERYRTKADYKCHRREVARLVDPKNAKYNRMCTLLDERGCFLPLHI